MFTLAEKVATIATTRRSGTFGTLVEVPAGPPELPYPAAWRIVTDCGKCFIVRSTAHGWSVRFGGFEGIDADCEEATRLALSGGERRNVCSVSDALGLAAK